MITENEIPNWKKDMNENRREFYQEGYEQGKKDTIEAFKVALHKECIINHEIFADNSILYNLISGIIEQIEEQKE